MEIPGCTNGGNHFTITRQISESVPNLRRNRTGTSPVLVEALSVADRVARARSGGCEHATRGTLCRRLMLMLDGRPWINPQVLRAGVIYDLKAKIMAPTWPTAADRLVLNFVTTLSPEHRQVSPIVIHRSEVEGGAEANWGYIEFPVGQSMLAEPALLQMRASFLSATNAAFVRTATIAGYAELHVRASDSKSTPLLSKYRAPPATVQRR